MFFLTSTIFISPYLTCRHVFVEQILLAFSTITVDHLCAVFEKHLSLFIPLPVFIGGHNVSLHCRGATVGKAQDLASHTLQFTFSRTSALNYRTFVLMMGPSWSVNTVLQVQLVWAAEFSLGPCFSSS